MKSRLESQLKDQADKLHEYYNSRMQDILKVQSDKMAQVELEFVRKKERKLLELEEGANARILETETRFKLEFDSMRNQYESEVAALRRENAEKGRLIGAVSRQLQSFENGNEIVSPTTVELSRNLQQGSTKSRNHSKKPEAGAVSNHQNPGPITRSTVRNPGQSGIYGSSNLEFVSNDMKNCIAALVNAYKEKNS